MDIVRLKSYISDVIGEEGIKENANMAEYSSFKAGGCADLLVIPRNIDQLRYLLYLLGGASNASCDCGASNARCGCESAKEGSAECSGGKTNGGCGACCSKGHIPYMIIGNSSNLLVRDGGYRGVLIKLDGEFNDIKIQGQYITAGAAALLSKVSKAALEASLSGLEFASGIPGSIGGGVFMNAGAYGGELKERLYSVRYISKDGMTEALKFADELEFGYRHSTFCDTGDIITEVTMKLQKGNREEIASLMKELAVKRNSKQPVNLPSAGSTFKRPQNNYAGTLIENAGLKGLSVGGAQVSELHAGFIVNKQAATAKDILSLMKLVQHIVYDKSGVMLEPEVRIIGEE